MDSDIIDNANTSVLPSSCRLGVVVSKSAPFNRTIYTICRGFDASQYIRAKSGIIFHEAVEIMHH